jgi:hypothetical protein
MQPEQRRVQMGRRHIDRCRRLVPFPLFCVSWKPSWSLEREPWGALYDVGQCGCPGVLETSHLLVKHRPETCTCSSRSRFDGEFRLELQVFILLLSFTYEGSRLGGLFSRGRSSPSLVPRENKPSPRVALEAWRGSSRPRGWQRREAWRPRFIHFSCKTTSRIQFDRTEKFPTDRMGWRDPSHLLIHPASQAVPRSAPAR